MAGPQPTHSTPAPDTKPRKSRRFRKARKQPVNAPMTHPSKTPWWVNLLTGAGRPVVAAVVLVMCAPGEHHLGVLAGWDFWLAWGMAGVLAAYAGIAAAVASKRPKGAAGRASAIIGAWLALAAGMSAQPVSHMFVTGHWSADPRPPVWLVISVSCVPPLVLGHLLHLAATPVSAQATAADAPVVERADEAPEPAVEVSGTAAQPVLPPVPPTPPIVYSDPRCAVIRGLYDSGFRPGTKQMRAAITAAGLAVPSDATIRGSLRAEVETHEKHLAQLPAAPVQLLGRTAP